MSQSGNTSMRVYPKRNMEDFRSPSDAEGQYSVEEILATATAFLECGGLFEKGRNPLGEVDERTQVQFGDFSKLLMLAQELSDIAPIGETRLSRRQQSELEAIGVRAGAYKSFRRKLSDYGVKEVPSFQDESHVDVLIKRLYDHGCLFTIVTRGGNTLDGVFDSFKDEPWHKLDRDSTVKASSVAVLGLTLVFHREEEKPEDARQRDWFELSPMDFEYSARSRPKSPKTMILKLAAEVDASRLHTLGIAEVEERPGYNPEKDCCTVRRVYRVDHREIDCRDVTQPDHAKASEELAHLLANAMSNADLRKRFIKRSAEIDALAELWKAFIQYESQRFRRSGDKYEYFKTNFLKALAGRVRLGNEDLSYLKPSAMDMTSLVREEFFSPGSLPRGWEKETNLFDGSALAAQLAEMQAFAEAHPERRNLPGEGWLINADGTFEKPSMVPSATRRGVELRFRFVWPEQYFLQKFLDGPRVVFQPEGEPPQAVIEAARSIEERSGFSRNAFGLDPEAALQMQAVVGEVLELVPECPCCGESIAEMLEDPSAPGKLSTAEGLTICEKAGAILRLSNRQASFGTGWSKRVGDIDSGTVYYRGFNKQGRLVLTLKVDTGS